MHPPKLILCTTQCLADGTQVLFQMPNSKFWETGIWNDYYGTDGGVVTIDDIISAEELPSHVFRIVK